MTGCSAIRQYLPEKDYSDPPMELEEFTPKIKTKILWSTRIGKGTKNHYLRLSPFIIDDQIIAVDYSGQVSAFDGISGKRQWETKLNLPLTAAGGGEHLIIVGTENAEVVALDAEKGNTLWKTAVSSEILSAPSIKEGIVVVRAVDGQIYGLNAEDGSRLWVYQYSIPSLTLRGTAVPVIDNDKVIIGLPGGKLIALSLDDGQLLWERGIVIPRGRTELDRLADINATPVLYAGYAYTVTYNGKIAAVWLTNGDVLWAREMSSYAGINIDGSNLYVTDIDNYVWALDSRTGASLWRQSKLLRRRLTAPISYDGYVVVGDYEGYLHWMSKDDGHFITRLRVKKAGIINAPLVVENRIYVTNEKGILSAVQIIED
ncbi:Outer membrane protein assembly factor BamB [Candidatus Nitrosacidococcus tergens]|uniref:Outer membrane protein assembly factor BamB n=1 Tax=Candidatus Nitrosacidococcus tergens TaxID=553981 RepID=A0A7G1Q8R1_9GAMM|nr:outer membrane protein assembly factor BamB [Candidatus Nitrosacidococcus tergens]CAB1274925.1 Outer membrane protein assembly factor BamB [Candidatus Nitrosacidococcus tergens]